MKLANYLDGSPIRAGIVEDNLIYPVSGERQSSVDDVLARDTPASRAGPNDFV